MPSQTNMIFPPNNHPRRRNPNLPVRQEWIARGSPSTTPTPSQPSSPSIPGDGNDGVSTNPVASDTRFKGSSSNGGHFDQRRKDGDGILAKNPAAALAAAATKDKAKEREKLKEKVVKVKEKDTSVPQLVQELQDKLTKGNVECMICYDMVRRSAPIWSCSSCFSIFHLNCIKKWARAPTSTDLSSATTTTTTDKKNHALNWRCPGCQSVQLCSSRDIHYTCFCRKRPDPPFDLYLTPHSCGEPCGKPLERAVMHDADTSDDDRCPHVCVLQCHPGPCPPCKAFAPPCLCPCGKKTITTRCFDRKSVLTCGDQCGKLLTCGRHLCQKMCHTGPCEPCRVLKNAVCFCKKESQVVLCSEMTVKGEMSDSDGVFSCASVCGRRLNCGNHDCVQTCHPGPCGDCELMPSKIKTCCCGKTQLLIERSSCLDQIPTCTQICGRFLPCGIHHCKEACHVGACPPCMVIVSQNCRCGSSARNVECSRKMDEKFVCGKPCGRKKELW